jgi:hypothetical protein
MGLPSADIPASLAEAERLRQSLLSNAGRGDLLKTIIDRVELRPNGLRRILSLVPLTPAAAPPNRLQGRVLTREFPLRIKRRGVEMRFAIDGVSVAAYSRSASRHNRPEPNPISYASRHHISLSRTDPTPPLQEAK